ncbi:helix-turn-helix domain-containing protein [Oribacterium sp. oral taxon 102]|uniref:helix-turn-helix domain-containing protein n=1 Tax=Oribacterium sp. oral taxon 102 TaxID=671214 RepID=UPI001FACED95|nr:helix-turn-helix domain-containing protein [Oribacterium sp. oral taxon 102]
MRFRLSLIRYAQKHGVTKAAGRYRVNRQFIYRWMKRYDGSRESLSYRSRRPPQSSQPAYPGGVETHLRHAPQEPKRRALSPSG